MLDWLINVSNKSDSSSAVVCCLRRFNNSKRCSSSKIYSLFLSLVVEVFEERRVRFDVDRFARINKDQYEFRRFIYVVVEWRNLIDQD